MKTALTSPLLRLRIMLLRANPLVLAAGIIVLVMAGALTWTLHAVWTMERAQAARDAQARQKAQVATVLAPPAAPAPVPAPAQVPDNLDAYYGALGARGSAEQQVKTLFGLAAKSGLVLRQGEYKPGYDRNARVYTYQVNLPVKGSYAAIWQFAMAALRTIPFASLDEITFHRDAIGDATVDARLKLTLYLRDGTDSS
jgi:type VI protein secretion system component VasK